MPEIQLPDELRREIHAALVGDSTAALGDALVSVAQAAGLSYDTEVAELADELESIGWPELAQDIREGVGPTEALRRLNEIGEGGSDAAEILTEWAVS